MAIFVSPEEAVGHISSGDRVFIHGVAAAPRVLIDAMVGRSAELRDVELVHLHTEGRAPYSLPEHESSFHVNAFFVGGNVREAVNEGRGDYIPVFLSEIPALFRRNYSARCCFDQRLSAGLARILLAWCLGRYRSCGGRHCEDRNRTDQSACAKNHWR